MVHVQGMLCYDMINMVMTFSYDKGDNNFLQSLNLKCTCLPCITSSNVIILWMFYLLMPFNLHSQVIKCCFYDYIISILSWNHEWHFCLWEFLTNHVWHFLFLRYFFSTIVQSFDFVDIMFNKNKNLLIFCKQEVLKKNWKKSLGD
jgi:hypothetical protein